MTIEELKKLYSKKNVLCGKMGKIYLPYKMILTDIKCNKWFCKECRKNKKFELYLDILRYVYIYGLQNHFIITSSGKIFRDICSAEESYKFMAKQWIKYKKCIEHRYGKLTYIVLPRSQKDGYCHYHILTSKYIDWSFLDQKRKRYGLGFVSISRNKDVAEYLNTDYFKDYEWIIPLKIKHFQCSRNIKINSTIGQAEKLIFNKKLKDEEIIERIFMHTGDKYNMLDYYTEKRINEDITFLSLKKIEEKEIMEEIKKW